MRPLPCVLLLAVLGCSPEPLEALTAAPDLPAPEALDPLVEKIHRVAPRVEGRTAVFTVLRAFELRGASAASGTRVVQLPSDSSLRGLRLSVGDRWLEGEVLAEDDALERYHGSEGALAARAVLLHRDSRDAELNVTLTDAGALAWVSYELRAPLLLDEGQWTAHYPTAADALPPVFDFAFAPAGSMAERAVASEEVAEADGHWGARDVPAEDALPPVFGAAEGRAARVAHDESVTGAEEPDDSEGEGEEAADAEYVVRLGRPTFEGLEVRWGRFPVDATRSLWRLELAAAPQLRPEPSRVSVVFALDASRSQGRTGLERQLALVRSYLATAPNPEVELVVYRRKAVRLFGRWVAPAELPGALAALPPSALALENGSNLEEASALAADVARTGSGEPRVVLFTDGALRDAFPLEASARQLATLPSQAVVQVALVGEHEGTEGAPDVPSGHALEPLAAARGGEVVDFDGVATAQIGLLTAQELVRPLKVRDLSYSTLDFALDGPVSLARGQGEGLMSLATRPPAQVEVTGRIWGQPVRMRVGEESALSRELPFFAVHAGSQLGLSSDDVTLLVRHTGALGEGHALFATSSWPSVGVEAAGLWGAGCLGGCSFGSSTGCGGGLGLSPSLAERLKPLVTPRAEACARSLSLDAPEVDVRVELTGLEVVDVAAHSPSAAFTHCVEEAVWALELDDAFRSDDGAAELSL